MSLKNRIYLSPPHMGGTEHKYIEDAFKTNWISSLGPNVDNFERSLRDYTGIKDSAVLSSGTAALHMALILLDVQPGDYVLVQSFTFSATVNPIVYLGATPILIDSEKDTWNMDPDLLEQAILNCIEGKVPGPGMMHSIKDIPYKSRSYAGSNILQSIGSISKSACRLPKAIIPVHLYGMPANMERIMAIADNYNIPVIEDAAEAIGSRFDGKHVGTFGDIGILSFNGNKIITTSGGGSIISDNPAYIRKARFLATQARDDAPYYQHSQVGYNYRMSNVIAGIGCGQMEVLDERIRQRRENFDFYKENLKDIDGITFLNEPSEKYFSNRWLTTMLIDPDKTGVDNEEVRVILEKSNIETRPHWKPMHQQPVFAHYPAYVNGFSDMLFEQGLCLPSGSSLTDEDRERVITALRKSLTQREVKGYRKGMTA
jgi:dTDP-4-amino-4,6-dideoxygalactose transaminase